MSGALALPTDDFVWDPLLSAIQGRFKRRGRHTLVCCPLCSERGETTDTKYRASIMHDHLGIGINCYNCGFKSKFVLGEPLSWGMKKFMRGVGVSEREVVMAQFRAKEIQKEAAASPTLAAALQIADPVPAFEERKLPPGSKTISQWAKDGCDDPDFLETAAYMFSRGDDIADPDYFCWSPSRERSIHRRLLMPFHHEGKIVGWTGRAIDPEVSPKYWASEPANFLYNAAAMTKPGRKYVIIVEGTMDARALDCVGTLGAEISPEMANWLNSCPLTKVLLPDRDKAGHRLIDTALKYGWHVSFPRYAGRRYWEANVKDAAQAAERYGRLYALSTTLAGSTDRRFEINMKRRTAM